MSKYTPQAVTTGVQSDDALFRKISLRILPIVWICFILNYLDKTNVSYAQLQMQGELGFSDAVFGIGASLLFIGLILFEIPSNVMLAKAGIRKTLLRIMSLWGLCTVAMCFVTSSTEFYVLRFLVGVFEAGFAPGVLYYLSLWYPDRRRAQAVAIFYTATATARIISGPIAATLMTKFNGAWDLQGWQWLFIFEGLPCIIFGVIAYVMLSNSPQEARWLNDGEREQLQAHLKRDGLAEHRFHWERFVELFLDIRLWTCGLIGFLILIGVFGLTFWQPTLLKGMGLSITEVGWYSAIPSLFGVVTSIFLARHSDKTGERCWHFVFAALLGATGLFMTTLFPTSPIVMIACLTLTWIGLNSAYALTWALPGRILVGRHAATGLAMLTVMQGAAGIVAPAAIAMLKTATGNFTSSLYLMCGACFGAALMCIIYYRAWPVAAPEVNGRATTELKGS